MGFDVIVIGSGFGGAITGCRLAEAGMKVLISGAWQALGAQGRPRRHGLSAARYRPLDLGPELS